MPAGRFCTIKAPVIGLVLHHKGTGHRAVGTGRLHSISLLTLSTRSTEDVFTYRVDIPPENQLSMAYSWDNGDIMASGVILPGFKSHRQ